MSTSSPGPGTSAPAPVRSLADDLRSRDTGRLVRLLQARPDLAVPVPADVATLAARATTRASVARALDELDARQLQVAEVLAVLPEPTDPDAVGRLWGEDATEPLAQLHDRGLVWVGEDGVRAVRMLRDLLGPYPGGLGPPLAEALDRRSPAALAELGSRLGVAPSGDPTTVVERVAAVLGDADTLGRLLESGPPDAARVLDRLTWGPPVGSVGAPGGAVRDGVSWLLRHGMLAAADQGHVLLPREVALARRGGRVHADVATGPPPLAAERHELAGVDRLAAGAATEAVRLVGRLLSWLDGHRVAALRTGGLGVRDLRRLAGVLGLDEPGAARVAETAYAAGLVVDDAEADPAFVPSRESDAWLDDDTADRWLVLARGWLAGTRVASLVGSREQGGAVRAAWSEAVERPASAELRHRLLEVLAEVTPGDAVPVDGVLARLAYDAPRRSGPARDDLARALLADAEWLGLTARGALSTPGRRLAPPGPSRLGTGAREGADGEGGDAAAGAAMRGLLPTPVERLHLQGDLTAVAPGPLVAWLEAEMSLLADVESPGAATVYRFTADSVRRALDAGRDADTVLQVLGRASATGVPQPLEYLVRDVARRHGVLRVGTAAAYVRSDDEATLAELLADRRAAGLGLRRLAPSVLVSSAEPAALLRGLRAMGAAPVAEGPAGVVEVRAPRRRPAARAARTRDPRPDPARLAEAVDRWRIVESGPRPGSTELPRMEPAVSLSVLRGALERGDRVWIGYVDETGRATQRLVMPRALEAGRLTADEIGRAGPRLFSVHRVTGAVLESVDD